MSDTVINVTGIATIARKARDPWVIAGLTIYLLFLGSRCWLT